MATELEKLAYCGGQFYYRDEHNQAAHVSEFSDHCRICCARLETMKAARALGHEEAAKAMCEDCKNKLKLMFNNDKPLHIYPLKEGGYLTRFCKAAAIRALSKEG